MSISNKEYKSGDTLIIKNNLAEHNFPINAKVIYVGKHPNTAQLLGVRSDIIGYEGHNLGGMIATSTGQWVNENDVILEDIPSSTSSVKFYRAYIAKFDLDTIICAVDTNYLFIYHNDKLIRLNSSEIVLKYPVNTIPNWIKVKIKDCKLSASLFPGNKKIRETLIGKTFNTAGYFPEYLCKMDKIKRPVISVSCALPNIPNKVLKFVEEEVEILYPSIKGWTLPKDRVIKAGDRVKCVNNREYRKCTTLRIRKNEMFTVKKLLVDSQVPLLEIIDSHQNQFVGYQKDFKKI